MTTDFIVCNVMILILNRTLNLRMEVEFFHEHTCIVLLNTHILHFSSDCVLMGYMHLLSHIFGSSARLACACTPEILIPHITDI